ncbi:MAG: hypothetical protein ACE5PT_15090 [Gemmatimonadales bacterium]
MRVPVLLLTVCVAVVTARGGSAQEERSVRSRLLVESVPEMGLRAGWEFDAGAPGIGGQVRMPGGPFADLVASGDYFVTDDGPSWQGNVDFAVRLGGRQALYGGVGLAVARRVFQMDDVPMLPRQTKVGINLFAGVGPPRFLRLPLRPYIELRQTFISEFDSQLYIAGGVNVPL